MPFTIPQDTQVKRRRILINGPPNSGKTTSLLTFPGKRVIISCPDEGGYDTLPKNDPETVVLVYGADALTKNANSTVLVEETRKACHAAIKGEYGEIQTLAVEGLHKLHARILDDLSGGEFFAGAVTGGKEGMDPRTYGGAERKLFEFLSLVCHSKIPIVVFTVWDEHEADRKIQPGENWNTVPTHKMPALYGKTATRIMGEFSVVIHASKGKLDPKDTHAVYRWQTKPAGEIWGCTIKAPKEVTEKIPLYVPQDWNILAGYLGLNTISNKETTE